MRNIPLIVVISLCVVVAHATNYYFPGSEPQEDLCQSVIQTYVYEPNDNMPIASWSSTPPRVGEKVLLFGNGPVRSYLVQSVQWATPRDTHNCGVVKVRVTVVGF